MVIPINSTSNPDEIHPHLNTPSASTPYNTKRCNKCVPCLTDKCGQCHICQGTNPRRSCVKRRCIHWTKPLTSTPTNNFQNNSVESEPLNTPLASTSKWNAKRCNKCVPCLTDKCGECHICQGTNPRRSCVKRRCIRWTNPLTSTPTNNFQNNNVKSEPLLHVNKGRRPRCNKCKNCVREKCMVCGPCTSGNPKKVCIEKKCLQSGSKNLIQLKQELDKETEEPETNVLRALNLFPSRSSTPVPCGEEGKEGCGSCMGCLTIACGVCEPCGNKALGQLCVKKQCLEVNNPSLEKELKVKLEVKEQEKTDHNKMSTKKIKHKRCGTCEGCKSERCGVCSRCMHPEWNRVCIKRQCHVILNSKKVGYLDICQKNFLHVGTRRVPFAVSFTI